MMGFSLQVVGSGPGDLAVVGGCGLGDLVQACQDALDVSGLAAAVDDVGGAHGGVGGDLGGLGGDGQAHQDAAQEVLGVHGSAQFHSGQAEHVVLGLVGGGLIAVVDAEHVEDVHGVAVGDVDLGQVAACFVGLGEHGPVTFAFFTLAAGEGRVSCSDGQDEVFGVFEGG